MRETYDIGSTASIIKQDIDDTNSKLYKALSWMQNFNEFLDLGRIYNGKIMGQSKVTELIAPYEWNDYDAADTTTGISLVMSQGINIRRNYIRSTTPPDLLVGLYQIMYFTDYYGNTRSISVACGHDATHFRCDVYVDDVHIDNLDDFNFDSLLINDISLCAYISNLKESVQVNEFLNDMVNTLKVPASFPLVINKWLNVSNISTATKEAIASAIQFVDGKPFSILTWLRNVYENMSSAMTDDDEITFSSTDYVVRQSFTSIASAAITSLATMVSLIVMSVSKIAGAILFALSSIVQAFAQAWQNRVNPLITIKPDCTYYNGFLPIPIVQEQVSYSSNIAIAAVNDTASKNIRLNTFLADFRIFKNKGTNMNTNWEGFLKCPIGPNKLVSLIATKYSSGIMFPQTGISGIDKIFYECYDSEEINGFEIASMPYEKNQATFVLLHLYLLFSCIGKYATPSSDSGLACYNAIANDTATLAQLIRFFETMGAWCQDRVTNNDTYSAFYSDSSSVVTYSINWDFVINHLIPLVRNNIHSDLRTGSTYQTAFNYIRQQDFINANENMITPLARPYNEHMCSTWIEDALEQEHSPFIIPKYTSAGFVLNLVLSVVAIAATVAIAAVATYKFKQFTRKLSVNKVAHLNELRDFNNSVQTDPSYSRADKQAAFKMYDRAVKSYNRTSWLWGGGTWSATNGWLDYASGTDSTSKIADAITSTFNEQILSFSSASNEIDNASRLDSIYGIQSIEDDTDSLVSNVNELKTLITG